jgi:hypothetical protein
MIRLTLAVAAIALAAPPAYANPVLEPAFENTIISTYPDGRQAKLWLNPDGTYRATGRRGQPTSGRWRLKGQQICMKQKRPFPAPVTYCTAVKQGGIGTTWAGKAVTGEPIRISLVAGR